MLFVSGGLFKIIHHHQRQQGYFKTLWFTLLWKQWRWSLKYAASICIKSLVHVQMNIMQSWYACVWLLRMNNDSFMLRKGIRCPSFCGIALNDILSAPSSVQADGNVMNAYNSWRFMPTAPSHTFKQMGERLKAAKTDHFLLSIDLVNIVWIYWLVYGKNVHSSFLKSMRMSWFCLPKTHF